MGITPDGRPVAVPPVGPVAGSVDDYGVLAFRGIPFAEAPVGALRHARPVPRALWTAPLDAGEYGPTAAQKQTEGPLTAVLPNTVIPGDDSLNLNVWTPDTSASLPVMVFIHGGSWTIGSGAVGGYNGTRFARDGVVLVTINYRLGADGFLWFGDGTPNLGLLDQVAALTWVQENIAAFGGNPDLVTVFGESSGAMSIGALLTMPSAKGLFQRAILQSGAGRHAMSQDSAVLVANRLAEILGVERTREAVAAVPRARLLDAQAQLSAEVSKKPRKKLWGDVAANGLPFEPVIDGQILPSLPIDAIHTGAASDVDIMIGTNSEEAMLLLAPAGVQKIKRWMLPAVAIRVGLPPLRGVRAYRNERRHARPVDHASAMITDWIYRIPAMRLAEAHPRTHVYEFAWRSPAFKGELGACHGAELPFVFDQLDHPDWAALTGGTAPQHLADTIHAAWVTFARTGNPGWNTYDTTARTVMRFDTPTTKESDPAPGIRELWHGRR